MTPKRKYTPHGYIHIFQITLDRGLCFYTVADCLVWFTLFCTLAVKYGVKVLAVCIMLNHFHIEAAFPSREKMIAMMRELDARFTQQYNRHYGLSGSLFQGRYGSAIKVKEQKIRDNVIYILNNPIPKRAVSRPEKYRWNFLAYMDSDHPFSEKVVIRRSSRHLLAVLGMVRQYRAQDKSLGYSFFSGMYEKLSPEECLQVIDYVVTRYNVINYGVLRRMWGDYRSLCDALKVVGGAEYDLNDDCSQEDYRRYYRMANLAPRLCGIDLSVARFDVLDGGERLRLAHLFYQETEASRTELAKFLHAPFL